jgi:hypothetical protein
LPVEFAPEVLADPIGVIAERKPGLDSSTITCAVEEIAGGRVKRRRLAEGLLDRPRVLDDGHSPARRAVGDLLIVLNKAGAKSISTPVCAGRGKHLRTLQRRGDQWYCVVCGPVRQPCGHGPKSRNSPPSTRQRSDGTVPAASSTPRPDGITLGGCCTTNRSYVQRRIMSGVVPDTGCRAGGGPLRTA